MHRSKNMIMKLLRIFSNPLNLPQNNEICQDFDYFGESKR